MRAWRMVYEVKAVRILKEPFGISHAARPLIPELRRAPFGIVFGEEVESLLLEAFGGRLLHLGRRLIAPGLFAHGTIGLALQVLVVVLIDARGVGAVVGIGLLLLF